MRAYRDLLLLADGVENKLLFYICTNVNAVKALAIGVYAPCRASALRWLDSV